MYCMKNFIVHIKYFIIEGSPGQEWGSCGGRGREQPEAGSQCVDGGNEGPTGQHPTCRPTCGEPGRGGRGEGGGGVGLTSQGQGSGDQGLTLLGEGEMGQGSVFGEKPTMWSNEK